MEQPPYSAQTPITQVMDGSPLAVRLLLDKHAACPGCSMAAYCILEDVCKNHNLDLALLILQLHELQ